MIPAIRLTTLIGLLLLPSITYGMQPEAESDSIRVPATSVDQSFRLGSDSTTADTALATPPLFPPGLWASPTGALLRSVAFPGWGQWSNGKKQKAAIYFAIESYFITKALVWRHRAENATTAGEYENARDRRNLAYWMTGLTVFVSMFDAYADRYLLVLERTRREDDDFWGGPAQSLGNPSDRWQLAMIYRF